MIELALADYRNPVHAQAVVALLDSYARDPAGGGTPLAPQVLAGLPEALAQRPQAFSVLAFDGWSPVGLVNCIEGFSTFACRPLVNVHDVVVLASHRGQRITQRMLQRVGLLLDARMQGSLGSKAPPVQCRFGREPYRAPRCRAPRGAHPSRDRREGAPAPAGHAPAVRQRCECETAEGYNVEGN